MYFNVVYKTGSKTILCVLSTTSPLRGAMVKNPHLQSVSVGRWSSSTAADPVEWRQPCRRSPSLTEHAPAPHWEDKNRKCQPLQTSLQQLFTISSQQPPPIHYSCRYLQISKVLGLLWDRHIDRFDRKLQRGHQSQQNYSSQSEPLSFYIIPFTDMGTERS